MRPDKEIQPVLLPGWAAASARLATTRNAGMRTLRAMVIFQSTVATETLHRQDWAEYNASALRAGVALHYSHKSDAAHVCVVWLSRVLHAWPKYWCCFIRAKG